MNYFVQQTFGYRSARTKVNKVRFEIELSKFAQRNTGDLKTGRISMHCTQCSKAAQTLLLFMCFDCAKPIKTIGRGSSTLKS